MRWRPQVRCIIYQSGMGGSLSIIIRSKCMWRSWCSSWWNKSTDQNAVLYNWHMMGWVGWNCTLLDERYGCTACHICHRLTEEKTPPQRKWRSFRLYMKTLETGNATGTSGQTISSIVNWACDTQFCLHYRLLLLLLVGWDYYYYYYLLLFVGWDWVPRYLLKSLGI
jgi:hypothetical protein